MTEFGTMSQITFDANIGPILDELDDVLAKGGETRKLCRLAGVREKTGTKSGEVLAEILKTALGPVIVYRSDTGELNPEDDTYRPWRQDRRRVPEPLTGDPEQSFDLMAKNGARYKIKARDFGARTFTFLGHAERLEFM